MTATPILTLLISAFCITAFAQVSDREWQAKAVEKYPALGIQGSELNERFLSVVAERHKIAPSFFANPKRPLVLADELAVTPPAAAPPKTPERTAQPEELPPPNSQAISSDAPTVSSLPEQTTPSTPQAVIQPAPPSKSPFLGGILPIVLVAAVGVTVLVAVANSKRRKVPVWSELTAKERGNCMRMAWVGYQPQSFETPFIVLLVGLGAGFAAFNLDVDVKWNLY